MTVFQQDAELPNIPSFLGWKFITLAGITVSSLLFKQMVKLCLIRINLHDKNSLFMKLRVNTKQQAFCAHFLRACYTILYSN